MNPNAPSIKTIAALSSAELKTIETSLKTDYSYQKELTVELDNFTAQFDQNIVNKIVLWKVDRYAKLSEKVLNLLNQISPEAAVLDEALTRDVLREILPIRGMRLAMASTLLRFRNPKLYQIIDRNVYRVVTGRPLNFPDEIPEQIGIYMKFLQELSNICKKYELDFSIADRTLFHIDKLILNKDISAKVRFNKKQS